MPGLYHSVVGSLCAHRDDEVFDLIRRASTHEMARTVILALLNDRDHPDVQATDQMIEMAMQRFFDVHQNCCYENPSHSDWVCSLSTFVRILWGRQMYSWLGKFYDLAFLGGTTFCDVSYLNRLIEAFAECAPWDVDPKRYYMTMEQLSWMDWRFHPYPRLRVAHGPFQSEADFLEWQSRNISSMMSREKRGDVYILALDLSKVEKLLSRLIATRLPLEPLAQVVGRQFEWMLANEEAKLRSCLSWHDRSGVDQVIERINGILDQLPQHEVVLPS